MFSQAVGFEPARGIPIGFQVQRLNHSATTACLATYKYVNLQNATCDVLLLFHL